MAITAKPKKNKVDSQPNNIEIDEQKAIAFIHQGGTSASTSEQVKSEDEDVQKAVIVRMYSDMIQDIDSLLNRIPKRKRPSRNTWILQAIEEKLKRDKKNIK